VETLRGDVGEKETEFEERKKEQEHLEERLRITYIGEILERIRISDDDNQDCQVRNKKVIDSFKKFELEVDNQRK